MDIETNLGFLMQNITTLGIDLLIFLSGILETLGDDHLYFSQYFLGVGKHHGFRKKKYGTLGHALRSC
jgi:hypothetical protein